MKQNRRAAHDLYAILIVTFVNCRTEVAATAEKCKGQWKAYANMPIVVWPAKIASGLKAHDVNDAQDSHSAEYSANATTATTINTTTKLHPAAQLAGGTAFADARREEAEKR